MRISDWSSDVCSADRQADADDPGDLVELAFEHQRLGDGQAVHVEDPVAVVGFHAFAPDRQRAGGGHDRARDQAASHWDALDWHRALAQYIDLLARTTDADDLVAVPATDLLSRERPPPPLDQALARVTLFRALAFERVGRG